MDRELTDIGSDESRRSILKKGALSIGALAVGASGPVAAQNQGDDDDVFDDQEYDKGLMYVGQARPGARFVISSPVLDWNPDIEEIQDNVWSEYNTRVIRYLNTDEQVLFWQAHEAEVPDFSPEAGYVVDAEGATGPNQTPQPEVFRMHTEWSPFGDAAFVTVNFTPVGEDEQQDLLDDDDWWIDDDDDGVGDGGVTGNATGNGVT